MIRPETLETRTVLSSVTVSFDATTSALAITGDVFNDNFTITENGDDTVTVAPGATLTVPGLGIVAGSSINGVFSPVGFHTGNPVSAISVTLPGTNNFDFVKLLGQGKTAPTTVRDVTVTATGSGAGTGGVNLNFAAKDVDNLGNFIVADTSSSAPAAALTATVDDCSFTTLSISQTGGLSTSVELGNDNVPGPVSLGEGDGNGDSITLDNGDTFGPTTLIQGGGGPTGAVGNSDPISVAGGRYRSLTIHQLLDGTNNTITINTAVISPFDPFDSDGMTTTQGNGAGDVTTISGVTTSGPTPPLSQLLSIGFALSSITVTQGNGSVGVGTAPGVNGSASVTNSNVPGNIIVTQTDAAANTPRYDTVLISGDTAGGSLGIVQGDAGGTIINGAPSPGDQAAISGSTSAGNSTISQGRGSHDSAAVSASTVGGGVSITQTDAVANPAGNTAQISGDTVTGRDSLMQGGANGDSAIVSPGSAGSISVTQLGGAVDTAAVNLTAVGGSVSVSQGDGMSDSGAVSVNTVADGVTISQGSGQGDGATVGPGTVGGSVSITQLDGGGDTAAISALTAAGGTNTVPVAIAIGQGGGAGDTAAISGGHAPNGNLAITQGDLGTSTVGDTASVLNMTVGTSPSGTPLHGDVTISQGNAPGDVARAQGGSSNDIAITQGDNVQVPNGGTVASDVAEINGTSVASDITITQGTGTSTLGNAGYYVAAIGFDYLGLAEGTAASSPVTAGFETVIKQFGANNEVFLGDSDSSFSTTFLDVYTGAGGGAFVMVQNTQTLGVAPLGSPFSSTFNIEGGGTGNEIFLDPTSALYVTFDPATFTLIG